jgi:cytochrome bd-type quinol oxidase subunit 1
MSALCAVAYKRMADGTFSPACFWGVLLKPRGLLQYMHTMSGAAITSSFVMAGPGAFYLLSHKHEEYARLFVRIGSKRKIDRRTSWPKSGISDAYEIQC